MHLRVLGRYTNTARNIDVSPGDEIEVNDELGQWLLNDAPGVFADPNAPTSPPADDQKPFSLPPDGTTAKTDATPPVVTGPESGVEIVHRADEDEQQQVLDEQAKQKALDAPPANKQITRPERKK